LQKICKIKLARASGEITLHFTFYTLHSKSHTLYILHSTLIKNIMKIKTPLNKKDLQKLKPKQIVYLSGTIYTARDAAHKRLVELLENSTEKSKQSSEATSKLPFNLEGAVIYYTGPCPAKPGEVIGSCGPTTSARMDAYTPALLDAGVIAVIGKGSRDESVIKSLKKNKATYFIAIGGCGAIYKNCVTSAEVIAFEDLGAEAIYKLEVKDMPLIVSVECKM